MPTTLRGFVHELSFCTTLTSYLEEAEVDGARLEETGHVVACSYT